jgi:hypothetical protein
LFLCSFYLAGGLAHHKPSTWRARVFKSGFTPLDDFLSPQLPECHLLLVWFRSVLGGLRPSSRVSQALSYRPSRKRQIWKHTGVCEFSYVIGW